MTCVRDEFGHNALRTRLAKRSPKTQDAKFESTIRTRKRGGARSSAFSVSVCTLYDRRKHHRSRAAPRSRCPQCRFHQALSLPDAFWPG